MRGAVAKGLTAALALAVIATVVVVTRSALAPQPADPVPADSAVSTTSGLAIPSATGGVAIAPDPTKLTEQAAASTAPRRAVVAANPPSDSDADAPRIVGRALDASGAPLDRKRLRATLLGLDWSPVDAFGADASSMLTDADGHFEWTPKTALDQRWEAVIRARVELKEIVAGFPVLPRTSGTLDVGDVRFEPPPLVVAGRLIDLSGRPVPRASLRVVALTPDEKPRSGVAELMTGFSDNDGTFALRQYPPERPRAGTTLELRVDSKGHVDVAAPFEHATDVGTIVLSPLGALEGRVVLDPSWRARTLSIRPERVDGKTGAGARDEPALTDRLVLPLNPDGRFRFDDLPGGRYDLYLEGRAWVGPLLLLWSDVSIEIGAAPVVLEPRDVRATVARTVFRVRDATGDPVTSIRVARGFGQRNRSHVHEQSMMSSRSSNDAFEFIHQVAGACVTFLPSDALREVLPCDGATHEVRLRAAPTVRLKWLRAADHAEPRVLNVSAWHRATNDTAKVDQPDGEPMSFAATDLGSWDVYVSAPGTVHQAVAVTIEVAAEPPVQTFELELPPEFLRPGAGDDR